MEKTIALSGFMGSGKSTVGALVAERLACDFTDLDARVVEREATSIARIFEERGERGFRLAEEAALTELLENPGPHGLVVALGGGTVTWPASAALLAEKAIVVTLRAPADRLWERVRETGRPLAQSKSDFVKLAAARSDAYRTTADIEIEVTDLDTDQIADAVIAALYPDGPLDASRHEGGDP